LNVGVPIFALSIVTEIAPGAPVGWVNIKFWLDPPSATSFIRILPPEAKLPVWVPGLPVAITVASFVVPTIFTQGLNVKFSRYLPGRTITTYTLDEEASNTEFIAACTVKKGFDKVPNFTPVAASFPFFATYTILSSSTLNSFTNSSIAAWTDVAANPEIVLE